MAGLRLFCFSAILALSVVAVNRCGTQPEAIADVYRVLPPPLSTPTHPYALDDRHSGQSGQDGTDGPNNLIEPNLQPQLSTAVPSIKPPSFLLSLPSFVSPVAPKIDPAEMVYTASVLYYFCGDNVSILDVYVDRLGHAKMRTFTRWNYPQPEWYTAELAKLEKHDQVKPVWRVELNHRCTKT